MSYAKTDLELMISKKEEIIWRGKPNKRGFVLEGIFNPMLPFAIIWTIIDISAFTFAVKTGEEGIGFIFIFLLLHMFPVWLYLAGIVATYIKYKNTQYIITDKGVYVSGGALSYTCNMKPFAELARVNIHRGIIDQLLGVGDVVFTSSNNGDFDSSSSNNKSAGIKIEDIKNYREIFDLCKRLQEDIYADTMYPNDLRPKENHGYKTKYRGLD